MTEEVRTYKAEEFVQALEARSDLGRFRGSTILGRVRLNGGTLPQRVLLEHTTFVGPVEFVGTEFCRGLLLRQCTFQRSFNLSEAVVNGGLQMDDVAVLFRPTAWNSRVPGNIALNLNELQVKGACRLPRLTVRGAITARSLRVDGDLDLKGFEAESGDFANLRLDGRLRISGLVEPGAPPEDVPAADGEVPFYDERAQITPASVIKWLDFRDARISGSVRFGALVVGGNLSFENARVEGSFRAICDLALADHSVVAGLVVREDLVLDGAQFEGRVSLHGVNVERSIRFISGSADEFEISPYFREANAHSDAPREVFSSIGRLHIRTSQIGGNIFLPFLQVTGAVSWENRRGVAIENCKIGGDVQFWAPSVAPRQQYDEMTDGRDRSACVEGDVFLTACDIGGEVTLTNAIIAGAIRLTDSIVAGDIAARSPASMIRDTGTVEWLRQELISEIGALGDERQVVAEAHSLDLTMVQARNDIDLTGLHLQKLTSDDRLAGAPRWVHKYSDLTGVSARHLRAVSRALWWTWVVLRSVWTRRPHNFRVFKPSRGWLEARGLKVKGNLQLYTDYRKEQEKVVGAARSEKWRERSKSLRIFDHAVIPAFANFRDLRANRFIVTSRDSFGGNLLWPRNGCRAGLVLAGAQIEVFDITPDETKRPGWFRRNIWDFGGAQPFPTPIDLTDVSIGLWQIGAGEELGSSDQASEIIDLLDGDPTFRRSTYVVAEKTLRNRGHDDEADQVFKESCIEANKQRWQDMFRRLRRILFLNEPPAASLKGLLSLPFLIAYHVAVYLPYRFLLGFGTNLLPLLFVIVAMFLASLPIYMTPSNIIPSIDIASADTAAYADGETRPTIKPPSSPETEAFPGEWRFWDGIATGLEVHVPIAALGVRGEWRLNNESGAIWSPGEAIQRMFGAEALDQESLEALRAYDYQFEHLTAEDWGMLATIANFLTWPLFLSFVLKRIFKGNAT